MPSTSQTGAAQSSGRILLTTLVDLIESLAPRGEREAIIAFQRNAPHQPPIDRMHYAELAVRIDLVASGLIGMGVTKGDHVAVLAPNQPTWIVAALASIRAGAVVVPIDVQLPDQALKHVLRDSKPRVLFTVKAQEERVRKSRAAPRTIILLDEDNNQRSEIRGQRSEGRSQTSDVRGSAGNEALTADLRRLPSEPGDPAILFYTSGTTGPPKGVPLTHRNIVHQLNVLTEIDLVRPSDRVLLPLPFHHVYPFVMGILTPLGLGVPIVLPQALTGPQLTRAVREGEVTVIIGVPRLYRALLDGIEREAKSAGRIPALLLKAALALSTFMRRWLGLRLGRYLLTPVRKRIGPKIRLVASGGAALSPEIAYRLEALGWQIATGYGLTETAPLLTLNYPSRGGGGGHSRLESAGKPIPGVELRIDPNAWPGDGKDSDHAEGEVLARGPNVFAGYLNLAEKNKEAFTDSKGDGWFRTGDLGWIDRDGFLHLTGRVSTMIVTEGGKHVQPDDVEEAYQAHPAIREIGIFQKDDPQRLVALVVPAQRQRSEVRGQKAEVPPQRVHSGQKADADKRNGVDEIIRQALDEQGRSLRPYERIAEYVITSDPLPRTRLGKIQHHLLEELYERARSGKADAKEKAGPMPEAQMSGEDQELLRDPAARATWEWLAERFPDVRLTPDSSLRADLQVDSMEWLNLTLEIGGRAGVELDDEAIGRVETVRNLLQEVSTASAGGEGDGARLEEALHEPEKFLDDEQRRWLEPLSPAQAVLARLLYFVNRGLMRLFFRVKVFGVERLPPSDAKGNFLIAPNHVSYLDSFAIAAALDYAHLKRTCWAGWTGATFRGPVTRWLSRLARVVPVDPDRAVLSSLALAVAVLKRGDNLVWFPEGARSADGRLQPLRPGIGFVLEHQPAAVIPAFIEGAHEAMPPGRFLPKPTRIRVTFGEAAESEALEREGQADEPRERITAALQKRLEGLAKQPAH